jgi:tripartite-type tricarboxylate transporter receptor subunit TctC
VWQILLQPLGAAAVAVLVILAGYTGLASPAGPPPSSPIRLVLTFPTGGSTDSTARLVAQKRRSGPRRPVIVDNKPGAGGNTGADFAAKAASDGCPMLSATSSRVTNRTLCKSLPYDFVQDLAALSRVAFVPEMPVAKPSNIRAANRAECIKTVKQSGAKVRLNYGAGGTDRPHHLAQPQGRRQHGARTVVQGRRARCGGIAWRAG